MKAALATTLATVACAVAAAGTPARSHDCLVAGNVCLGSLPPSHTRVTLKSLNGSGERGVAAVTLGLHQTKVVFRLTGAPAGVRQTVNLLKGGCGGRVLLRLGTIVNGRGVVRANSISRLSGFAIAVHASSGTGAAIAACAVVRAHRLPR
jgi:hypothetical protein